ncbi:peroxidase 29 [Selaginella moellendorffii]|nr:peroxidase 29 [Selaginella moellendorffii]|eukprot:XP_002977656.2 peroxidase 29 [Selaginella moellendorffii]
MDHSLTALSSRWRWSTFLFSAMILAEFFPLSQQLSYDYYDNVCPQAERTVRASISSNLAGDPTAAAALLRLAFHDCQVGGCDASIMLNSQGGITSEMVASKNFGIRRLNLIDNAKAAVDSQCGPGRVSCADIIAMAGRDAVVFAGGPDFRIPMGRLDSTFASNAAADSSLPPTTISVDNFLNLFGSMGMSTEESVAIMGGGHTLGVGHCVNIVNRLYPNAESTLSFVYATRLRVSCPSSDPRFIINATTVQNDFSSLQFDNQYFREATMGLGLFTIDAALASDARTSPIVARFSQNQNSFFNAFASAYAKLTSFNVLTGNRGEVRNNCRFVN